LNYLLAFKYNNNEVENTYYYLKALKGLSDLPIFFLPKSNLDSVDESEVTVKTINVFGKPINQNLTVNYKIFSSDNTLLEGITKLENSDTMVINMTSKFSRPGKYYVSLTAGTVKTTKITTMIENPKYDPNRVESNSTNSNSTSPVEPEMIETVMDSPKFFPSFSGTLRLLVSSKVKLNYLKCVVTNTGSKDAADGKEL
jgi:hypothetical protein